MEHARDDQIKHMVNRFLMWKLPADFSPDNGISLKNVFGQQWPIGTNLFTAAQAEAMVRYMIEGMSSPEVVTVTEEMRFEARQTSDVANAMSNWELDAIYEAMHKVSKLSPLVQGGQSG